MIEIYPALTVFCPETQQEQDGNNCLNCKHFRGVSFNDYELRETGKSMLFFRCFYKKEAEAKRNE